LEFQLKNKKNVTSIGQMKERKKKWGVKKIIAFFFLIFRKQKQGHKTNTIPNPFPTI